MSSPLSRTNTSLEEPAFARRVPTSAAMVAVFALGVFATGGRCLFQTGESLRCAFYDDAYYYFQIARNVAHGHGFTFDGVHATNGFHPLWLFVLTPLFRFIQDDFVAIRAVLALECLLIGTATAWLVWILRPRIGLPAAAVASLCLFAGPGLPRMLRAGLESSLVLILLVACWRAWVWFEERPSAPRRAAVVGAICALSFLARLELGVLALILAVTGRVRGRAAAALVGPTALSLVAYVAWSLGSFGVAAPISGMVKAEDAANDLSLADRLLRISAPPWQGREFLWKAMKSAGLGGWSYVAHAALAVALGILAVRHRGYIARATASLRIRPLAAATGLVVVLDILVLGSVAFWQAVPCLFVVALLTGALMQSAPRAASVTAIVSAGIGVAQGVRLGDRVGFATCAPDGMFEWVRENTTKGDPIASWNAGALGYFSHRRVIGLDGLVNDLEYHRAVSREGEGLDAYLDREGVRWLVDLACGDSGPRARVEWIDPSKRRLRVEAVASFRLEQETGCFKWDVVRVVHP